MKNSFDWKGLFFSLKVLVVGVTLGLAAQYGMTYYTSRTPNPTTTASAVVVAVPEPIAALPPQDTYSTTTPVRVINSLTIADAVPQSGKLIAADLVHMKIFLYQDRQEVGEFPILTKGRPGTPWETPAGFYTIQTKEPSHFSSIGRVYMPYSMQFYGNYFIHGWTYYPDGTPVSASFSGGCIKLQTDIAAKIFAFAEIGTKVFVYDAKQTPPLPSLVLSSWARPNISAPTYLVADIDTRDVYAEHDARVQQTTGETTKLMTALVANEIISLTKVVPIAEGELSNPPDPTQTSTKKFLVDDLFYPLLMHPGVVIADSLAAYYGNQGFVRWMNTTAHALSMDSTKFVDPNGTSQDNLSTPDDLFRLVSYLANKKSFVVNIMQTPRKKITATDGTPYIIKNTVFPLFSSTLPYQGRLPTP